MMTTQSSIETLSSNLEKHSQYFTFFLADEEYGIDILSVLEIRGLEHMTLIPSAPGFIKGVINLRGAIIPVMDLRERFNMTTIDYTRSTVLIVLQIKNHEQKKNIGIIVDAVSDVYSVNLNEIKPKPEICNTEGHDYISGLVTISQPNMDDKLVILLDVNKLLEIEDSLNKEDKHPGHETN